jgi:hypothetical protein
MRRLAFSGGGCQRVRNYFFLEMKGLVVGVLGEGLAEGRTVGICRGFWVTRGFRLSAEAALAGCFVAPPVCDAMREGWSDGEV